jgi:predicted hotdog family 3-hydroxylacyl-ACP dehydratase
MCLLDAILEFSQDRIACSARSHCHPMNPLRLAGRLGAIHLVEYAAQAIAAHGALSTAQESGAPDARPGMLAALRDVRFYIERLDTLDAPLSIDATRRLARYDGLVYDFTVRAAEQLLCEGRVVIALT